MLDERMHHRDVVVVETEVMPLLQPNSLGQLLEMHNGGGANSGGSCDTRAGIAPALIIDKRPVQLTMLTNCQNNKFCSLSCRASYIRLSVQPSRHLNQTYPHGI